MTSGESLRTGEVARAAGVNVQTLRYYERRGLLAEPERSLGGHRLYPPDTVTLLGVIRSAQRLGFTLDDIAKLLESDRHHPFGRDEAGLQLRLAAKLDEVETRITELTAVREALRDAIETGCDDLMVCAASDNCPLPLHAVEGR